MLVSCPQKDVE